MPVSSFHVDVDMVSDESQDDQSTVKSRTSPEALQNVVVPSQLAIYASGVMRITSASAVV